MNYQKELDIAVRAAVAAGKIQLDGRNTLLSIERKGDASPVTQIDKECEAQIIDMIRASFPTDSIVGEENGLLPGTSGRTWIIDPLDGTRPYIRGIPTYSVLIGLEDESGPLAGVINLPAMNELYFAAKGKGAFLNCERITVSSVSTLKEAMGTHLGAFDRMQDPCGQGLLRLMDSLDYNYGFMDAFSYAAVACGKADVSVSLVDKSWDRLGPAAIVLEAGGMVTDLSGNKTIHGDEVVFTNGILHDEVLRVLRGE